MITYNHLLIALIYLLLDVSWLYTTSSILYMHVFTRIQKSTVVPKVIPAIVAYILLICALWFMCIPLYKFHESTIKGDVKRVLLSFGLTGFVIYGIYNATNAAIFTDYPNMLMVYDTLWGGFIFTIMGLMYMFLSKRV